MLPEFAGYFVCYFSECWLAGHISFKNKDLSEKYEKCEKGVFTKIRGFADDGKNGWLNIGGTNWKINYENDFSFFKYEKKIGSS